MGNKPGKVKGKRVSKPTIPLLPSRPFCPLRAFGSGRSGCYSSNHGFSTSPRVITQLRHGGNDQIESRSQSGSEEVHCCAFAPDDENFLVTSSVPCDPRQETGMGHLRFFNISSGLCSKDILTYYSKECDISTDGELISFVTNPGQGEIAVAKRCRSSESGILDHVNRFQPQCNGLTGQTLCCQFSPDGSQLLSVASLDFHTIRETNELRLWNARSMQIVKRVLLRDLTDFCGFVTSCKFSPDGRFIACATSQEQLCILGASNLDIVSILRRRCRGNMLWCMFDPRSKHERLACCLQDGRIEIWQAQSLDSTVNNSGMAYTCELKSKVSTQIIRRLCCFQYSPDGSMIAIGTSDATIMMLQSDNLLKLYSLDCKVLGCPYSPQSNNTAVHCVAFSQSLQFVAAGYSDGLVRVWALPCKFSLQHLCRVAIMRLVAPSRVKMLPLPQSIKSFLLFTAT